MMWAVLFDDHIHTDYHGQLAIFATRKAADKWMSKYGIPGCRIAKIKVQQ